MTLWDSVRSLWDSVAYDFVLYCRYCEPNPFKSLTQKAEELILKVLIPYAKKLGLRQR